MDKQITIGSWLFGLNKSYEYGFMGSCNDPKLKEKLRRWAEQYAYWDRELLIDGIEYKWPEEWDDRILKPKYVVEHILYCVDLHKAFYETS